MLLLVNNSHRNDKVAQITKLKKALKALKIPFIDCKKDVEQYKNENIKGIILSGSSFKLSQPTELIDYKNNMRALMLFPNVPVLGICFGCQFLHLLHGGKLVNRGEFFCKSDIVNMEKCPLFTKQSETCFFCFSDMIVPKYTNPIAWFTLDNVKRPCAFNFGNNMYGCLFHPEARKETWYILENFINLC